MYTYNVTKNELFQTHFAKTLLNLEAIIFIF